MRITRSDRDTSIFVLKWADVQRFIEKTGEFFPIISIGAACADRLDRQFKDIEELRGFSNSKRAEIVELTFVARDEAYTQRFSISLNKSERRNVRILLDANEETAIKLSDFCDDFLDSLRPWYGWIARADWYFIVLGVWVLMQLGSLVLLMLASKSFSIGWSESEMPIGEFAKSFSVGLLPVFFGIIINKMRNRFFPMGVFAFGDGDNRHQHNEVIRTVLILGFAVSVVSSVVLSWFQ